MELQILYTQGVFQITGNFTGTKTQNVKTRFNTALNQYEEVILCLEKVTNIDKKAVVVLQEIYNKASKRSKVLFVLGKMNKKIVPIFTETRTSYLFRNDY